MAIIEGETRQAFRIFAPEECIDCSLCAWVCPAEAIQNQHGEIVPKLNKKDRPIAWVDETGCTGCEVCLECCPVDAIDKVASAVASDSSPTQVCRVNYDKCVSCSLCAVMCPWETISMALTRGEAEELAKLQGTTAAPAAA
ncbi:MAG TPA: 4Fe-4S binding protein [Kofleriaceae bacterium]|nr:4Fe-4S binding protein [Kofleriaceae bacterium]